MDPIWWIFFLIFLEFRKKTISRGDLGQHRPENSQADLGLDAAQIRVLHTLSSTKSTTAS